MSIAEEIAKRFGTRWGAAIHDQLLPLIGNNSLLAVRVYFTFDAPGSGIRSGEVTLQVAAGASALLQTAIEERLAGRLGVTHRETRQRETPRKS